MRSVKLSVTVEYDETKIELSQLVRDLDDLLLVGMVHVDPMLYIYVDPGEFRVETAPRESDTTSDAAYSDYVVRKMAGELD